MPGTKVGEQEDYGSACLHGVMLCKGNKNSDKERDGRSRGMTDPSTGKPIRFSSGTRGGKAMDAIPKGKNMILDMGCTP